MMRILKTKYKNEKPECQMQMKIQEVIIFLQLIGFCFASFQTRKDAQGNANP